MESVAVEDSEEEAVEMSVGIKSVEELSISVEDTRQRGGTYREEDDCDILLAE